MTIRATLTTPRLQVLFTVWTVTVCSETLVLVYVLVLGALALFFVKFVDFSLTR